MSGNLGDESLRALSMAAAPRVAFLGFCDRASEVRQGPPQLWHWNLIGVSMCRVSHVFPLVLRGTHLALGLFEPRVGEEFTVRLRPTRARKPYDIKIGIGAGKSVQTNQKIDERALQGGARLPGWYFLTVGFPEDAAIEEPGECKVYQVEADQEILLCTTNFLHAPVAPFTADDISAIRSDPLAMKFVRIQLKCKLCDASVKAYAGIEKSPRSEAEGWSWYESLPDRFRCTCGNADFSLTYIRTGLHGLLRRNLGPSASPVSGVRLYEKSALEEKCRELLALLGAGVKEEDLQVFISNNPIFLHVFTPQKLFVKPKILTKYVADFAVVNEKRELILVEIERPNLPLVRKDGGIRAGLSHAFEQVHNWMQVFNEHRSAALSCLDLKSEDVAKVRGAVIAGRTPGGVELARSLRAHSWRDAELFTCDDILNSVTEVVRHIATV